MSSEDIIFKYKKTKEKLNQVSPYFCLAKWLQVTLHLQNGLNHSCHHPIPHLISQSEMALSPSSLHNTQLKKEIRKQMLESNRPEECHYCWAIEETDSEHFSDRHIKSSDDWALPFFDQVKNLSPDANINPTYLEVSFSNACQFKCLYCIPNVSSAWMSELKKFGNFPTKSQHHALPNEQSFLVSETEKNPYIKAFWNWWPELSSNLKVLRVTGGEPLLLAETFKLLEHFKESFSSELIFAINSNLGVDRKIIEKLVDHIRPLISNNMIKEFILYTSLDTWGKHAEYIRHGLNLEHFKENLEFILQEIPNISLTFMCTYNFLSIYQFRGFLNYILNLKNKYSTTKIILDISYLKEPIFLSPTMAFGRMQDLIKSDLKFMKANAHNIAGAKGKIGFSEYEINKMQRLVTLIDESPDRNNLDFKKFQFSDFFKFITEIDKRRGLTFLDIFPEYQDFYNLGKTYSTISI